MPMDPGDRKFIMENGEGTMRCIRLGDEAATRALGAAIADNLRPGVPVLLGGDLGVGKSVLARAILRRAMDDPALEVPSPTFTLVQTYEGPEFDIWHVDLYRIEDPDEVIELGLEDAMADAACLIEWPDRLGRHAPRRALSVTLRHDPGVGGADAGRDATARLADIGWSVGAGDWTAVLDRLVRDTSTVDWREDGA